jgi:hypothetical protein
MRVVYVLSKYKSVTLKSVTVAHSPEVLLTGLANELSDQFELVYVVIAWEQWLSAKHLTKYTANTPHINSLIVVLHTKHDLRCSVPARHYVLSQIACSQ